MWYVMIPILLPGIIAVALFGFTLSYDEFPRSTFTVGARNTLPLEIWSMTTNITSPGALCSRYRDDGDLLLHHRRLADRHRPDPGAAPARPAQGAESLGARAASTRTMVPARIAADGASVIMAPP